MIYFCIIYLVIGFLFGLYGIMRMSKLHLPVWARITASLIEMVIWPVFLMSAIVYAIRIVRK